MQRSICSKKVDPESPGLCEINDYVIPQENLGERGFSLDSYLQYKFEAVSFMRIVQEMARNSLLPTEPELIPNDV